MNSTKVAKNSKNPKKGPKIIAIANQKGGEGKTTTTINLAYGLSRNSASVLVVDMDPQANTTSVFAKRNTTPSKTLKEVFNRTNELSSLIIETQYPNIRLAPASIALAEIEASMLNVDAPYILRDAIAKFAASATQVEYIVIDCPPTLSVFTVNALVAATHVLIPAQAEKFSVDGMSGLQKTINSIKNRINPDLLVLGVLITQLKKKTLLNQTVLPVISQFYPVFKQTISQGVSVGESHLARKSVPDYAPNSKQAKEYLSFVKEFLHELESKKIRVSS